MSKLAEVYKQSLHIPPSRSRTFGFFITYGAALVAVEKNQCDMHEKLYDYLVIECIEPGIHPEVLRETWFKWESNYPLPENAGFGKWVPTIKPMELQGTTNWALG